MKEVFEALFYNRPIDTTPFTFVHLKNDRGNYVHHTADIQLNYNELVDELEDEHFKRDVFTTDKAEVADDDPPIAAKQAPTTSKRKRTDTN